MALVIDDLDPRVHYSVGGTPEDEFDVPFAFFDDEDLKVYVDDDLLTLSTDYTVTGAGTSDSGLRQVTLVSAVSNAEVEIVRDVPLEVGSVVPEAGPLDLPAINLEFQRQIAIDQQLRDKLTRSIRQPESDEDDMAALPAKADRASKALFFDSNGDPAAVAGDLSAVPTSALGAAFVLLSTVLAQRQALLLDTHGADKASASTVNLDTATGDLVDVTGTTTITAITLAEGVEKTVRFTGVLTLTHGASLVLPGAANITTADGDFAVFRGYAAGVVRCVDYTRASGLPVVSSTPGKVFISSTSVSGAASLAITSGLDGAYDAYEIELYCNPATDNQAIYLTLSQDGGANYLNSGYRYALEVLDTGGSASPGGSGSDSKVLLSGNVGNATGEHANLTIRIEQPATASLFKLITWRGAYLDGTPALFHIDGSAVYLGNGNVIDAIKFAFASGNITGTAKLYGTRAS